MIIREDGKEFYGCIYLIDNTVNNKIYLGQTKDFNKRRRVHFKAYFKDRSNMPIDRSIHIHGKEKFNMQIIEYCETFEVMNEAEEFWIAYYKSIGAILYNIKKGGNNHKMSESTKEKISKANKGRPCFLTPQAIAEFIARSSKAIISIDQFGIKKEFSSIRKASSELGISTDSIQDVVSGIRESTVGHTFIYKKDENIKNIEDIIITNPPINKRKIIAIDKYGNKQEFKTAVLASETLKVHKGHIFDILHNKPNYKTLGGYTFVWEDDARDIKEILLNFVKKSKSPIIATDKDGNEQKYESVMELCRSLNISRGKMEMVLGGKRKINSDDQSINGYTFKRMSVE